MQVKRPVNAVGNNEERGQLKKSEDVCFHKQFFVPVKLLIAFMEGVHLYLPCLQRFIVVLDQMNFTEKRNSPRKQLARYLLVERDDQQQRRAAPLHQKPENRQAKHHRVLRADFLSVLKDNCNQTVGGNACLVNKKFLHQSRRCVACVDVLFRHHINLHRLPAALKRRDGAVKVPNHADLKCALHRVRTADAFCEKINQHGVEKKVGEHAAETNDQPFYFKLMDMLRQRQQPVIRKAEIGQQSNGKNNRKNIEDCFAAYLLFVANGHSAILRVVESPHFLSSF